ncbi:MAG: hypothetical protein WAO71_11170 [Gallionella sp.]
MRKYDYGNDYAVGNSLARQHPYLDSFTERGGTPHPHPYPPLEGIGIYTS